MGKRGVRTMLWRATTALAIAATVGAGSTACTGDSDDDGPDASALEICEDLTFVPCPRQTAVVALPLTGSRFSLVYASDRVPGRTVAAVLPAQDLGLAGWSLDVLHSYDADQHVLVMGGGARRHVDAVSMGSGRSGVGSVDGAQVYVFDSDGRQQLTLDALTGTHLLTFKWGKDGLESVTHPGGRVTQVVRDEAGELVAIVSDSGYRTRFGVLHGWLAAVADETGDLTRITTTKRGLVTAVAPAEGASTEYTYDDDGRLTKISGRGTRSLSLVRRDIDDGVEVSLTSAAGRTEVVRTQHKGADTVRTFVDSAGLVTKVTVSGDHRRVTTADGTTIDIDLTDDPVLGASAPVIAKAVTTTAGGRRQVVREQRSKVSRSIEVDGAKWATTYHTAQRQVVLRDPNGLTRTVTLDEAGRPVRVEASGAAARTYEYAARGVLESVTIGTGADARVWRYGHDTQTGSVTVTDPLGAVTSIANDANGRAQQVVTPGGEVEFERDALGRIVGITPPSGATAGSLYGQAGDVEVTTRPGRSDAPAFTVFERDKDGALRTVQTPGETPIAVHRDDAGRPTGIDLGDQQWALTYDASGALERVEGASSTLDRDVDAGAVVGERWSGPFDARVDRELDGQGRLTSVAVNEGDAVTYQYDDAGRVRRAGALELTRDPETGRVTEERLDALVRRWEYNIFGEVTAITVEVAGRTVQSLEVERDGLGRVVRRTEADGNGASRATTYSYDEAGRLASTVVNGGPAATYTYDANGNLIRETTADGSAVTSSYAADDTLVRRGNASYAYDRAGRLASVTSPNGKTSYRYDQLGNLLAVTPPSGAMTTYVVDGAGRRIARKGGVGQDRGLVYLDGIRPAAMLDRTGQVLTSFTYTSGEATPTYVNQGGRTLFVVIDDIGTPRALVDVETGATAWQLRTDEFGRVESRTDFAQFPFAFAGGLADPATNLLRFGARDYDPDSARWTAPDPIGFAGGDANLYRYAGGDPVNHTDPSGLVDSGCLPGEYADCSPAGPKPEPKPLSDGCLPGEYADCSPSGPKPDETPLPNGCLPGEYADCSPSGPRPTPVPAPPSNGCLPGEYADCSPSGPKLDETPSSGCLPGEYADCSPSRSEPEPGPLSNGCLPGEYADCSPSGPKPDETPLSSGCLPGEYADCSPSRLGATPEKDQPEPEPVGLCDLVPFACESDDEESDEKGGVSHDEPHLRTLDGVTFDFQGAGEYTALRSDSGDLVVQTRQQIQNGVRSVTWNMAIAVGVGRDRVTFARNETGWDVRLNGARIVPTAATELPGGGRLLPDGTGYSVVWADGSTVRVMPTYGQALNLQVVPAPGRIGTLHGLLGPFTGTTKAGTIEAADGTQLDGAARADRDRLYGVFGESWRITQRESRFDYRAGQTTETFTDRSIPDANPVRPSAMAKAVCRAAGLTGTDLGDCALDVTITGDASLALRARTALTAPPSNADRPVVPAVKPTVFTIAVGDTVAKDQPAAGAGEIAKAGDLDAYEIEGKAGTALALRAAPGCGSSDLAWQITGPPGSQVNIAKPICSDLGRVELDVNGTYTILVGIGSGGSGTYGFTVAAASSGGGNLAPGDTVSDRITDQGGKRVYRLHMDKGMVVYLRSLDGSCDQLQWAVGGPPAGGVANAKPMCSDMGRIHAGVDGTYTITVGGQPTSVGSYEFEVVPSKPDAVSTMEIGDTVSGSIAAPGALAIYKLQLDEGKSAYLRTGDTSCANSLRWDVSGPPGGNVANAKPMCSDIGQVLAGVDGTYTITVSGQDDAVGDYTFTVERI